MGGYVDGEIDNRKKNVPGMKLEITRALCALICACSWMSLYFFRDSKLTKTMAKIKIPAWFTKAIESYRISDEDKSTIVKAFGPLVNGEYEGAYFDPSKDFLELAFIWEHTPQGHEFWERINKAIK